MNLNMSGLPGQHQQFFAEYSLWNDSTYCSGIPRDPLFFTRPYYEDSIFLTPPPFENRVLAEELENKKRKEAAAKEEANRVKKLWFDKYLQHSLRVVPRDELWKSPDEFANFNDMKPKDAHLSYFTQPVEVAIEPPLPPAPPIIARARRPNNRGRKNAMQRRLEKALRQPVKMNKGASMMQRMGWSGGGLGRGGEGIVDPIAPNPQYAFSSSGFGFGDVEELPEVDPKASPPKKTKSNKKPKVNRVNYKTNILLHILQFVKTDLQQELYFDPALNNAERKRIHQIVAAMNGDENAVRNEGFDNIQQFEIVKDIHKRNAYVLGTQSDGEGAERQICVYKEPHDYMYLVTPDDLRNPQKPESEEETNPFLRSITKHMKNDVTDTVTENMSLYDRIVQYFVEFSNEDYTEFRFLGPYVMDEISVINSFLGVITCLTRNQPCPSCPDAIREVFERKDIKFDTEENCNGYVFIKKIPVPAEMEI